MKRHRLAVDYDAPPTWGLNQMSEDAVDLTGTTIRLNADLFGSVGSPVEFPMLSRRWLSLRGPVAAAAIVLGLTFGALFDWPTAFGVSALGAVLALDVALHHWNFVESVVWSVLLDATLVGTTLWILPASPAVVAMPYAYLIATTFLLLAPRRAFLPVAYEVLWMSFLLIGAQNWWVPVTGARAVAAGATIVGMFGASLIAMFVFTSRALDGIEASLARKARFEEAVSAISRAFAAGDEHTALDRVVVALLRGTEAASVFIERNVEDPVLGPCTSLVAEAISPAVIPDPPGKWEMVPWSMMPASHSVLSVGQPVVFNIVDLPEVERDLYAGSGIEAGLGFPVIVRGEWVGLIGLNDTAEGRARDELDIELLRTAAELTAAHWERIEGRQRLEEAVANLERRQLLEQGLTRTSAALLASDSLAVEDALNALLEATRADFVFVDENYSDDELGISTRMVHWVYDHLTLPADPAASWRHGPYSRFPTLHEMLAQGEPSVIYTSDLDGPERVLYEEDGVLSELSIPVFVRGEWRGSIAFTDFQKERRWTRQDIQFLGAAAEMVGVHWERRDAVVSLNTRLAYEEALAKVSGELLSEREDALEAAFEHLAAATGADYMWLEEVFDDPKAGRSSRVVHALQPPQLEGVHIADLWMGGPHSDTPTTPGRLARGEASILHTEDLEGGERAIYEADGLKSELVIPVFVFGKWTGAIGFAHYVKRREWHHNDIGVLRTAAQLVGSYLERQETRKRLEELVVSKDEFVASISHEIRTPLTSVIGFTSVIRDRYGDLPDEDRLEMLDLIHREAQEVAWIVDDLLVFARSDIGTLAFSSVDTPLYAQILAVLGSQPGDLAARVRVEDCEVSAIADPGRVRQVLRNLITNAFKYGGPNIEVTVVASDGRAEVRVSDDGDGVDESLQANIFDAYFRAHDPAGQPGSMGLGLSVALKLAHLMEGDLTYEHAGGKSVFTLSLPMAEGSPAVSA